MEEFNEASAAIFRGEEGVDGVVVDGIKDEPLLLPEEVAVEQDMCNCPYRFAVWACGVIIGGGTK